MSPLPMDPSLINHRYRVLQNLGRGGFGETFLVTDTQMPSGRQCVLKQLKPAVQTNPQQQQWVEDRFRREAAILEQLGEGTDQIPRLYAYFREGDHYYVVQEWVQGQTLYQRVCEGVMTEAEVRAMLCQILPVLDYVHSRRIVHRDIKPDNIILRSPDRKPVLIDFGAVKEAVASTVATPGMTPLSMAIGTPGYMASEQAAGRPAYVSDLYSLGLTAIFCLTGKQPQELLLDPQSGELQWRHFAPAVSPELVGILDRAIRFHPGDRFPNAQGMLASLIPGGAMPGLTTPAPVGPRTAATVAINPPAAIPSHPRTLASGDPTWTAQAQSSQSAGPRLVEVFLATAFMSLFGLGALSLGTWYYMSRQNPPDRPTITGEVPTTETPTPTDLTQEQPKPPTPKPESKPEPKPEPSTPVVETPPTPETPTSPTDANTNPSDTNANPTTDTTPGDGTETTGTLPNLPGFSLGSPKDQVLQTTGIPTSDRAGYWANSEAVLYKDYGQPGVDLGFIFDATSGELRQREITAPGNTSLDALQSAMVQLFDGSAPGDALNALSAVQTGQSGKVEFSQGDRQGIVERTPSGRIYLSVWQQGFHQR